MERYRTSVKVLDQGIEAPRMEVEALVVSLVPERSKVLYWLFVLNIVLQVFDGIATYSGLHLGIREGNPLLRNAFALWGVVPTLLFLKTNACGLLLFIYRFASPKLAVPALTMLAGVYSVCSLIPWLGMLFGLLVRLN